MKKFIVIVSALVLCIFCTSALQADYRNAYKENSKSCKTCRSCDRNNCENCGKHYGYRGAREYRD